VLPQYNKILRKLFCVDNSLHCAAFEGAEIKVEKHIVH